jgi:hypothetical protein
MILLIVSWLFCAGSIAAAWTWLQTYARYEVLESTESSESSPNVQQQLYLHRIVKAALLFCCLSLVFLTLHFVFAQVESDVERKMESTTRNMTLESLHSFEQFLESEANETAGAIVDHSGVI